MKRIFTYFVEPASYTVDLALNVHDKIGVDYIYIKNSSLAKSENNHPSRINSLKDMIFFQRIRFIYKVWRKSDLIIVNGYNNYVFIFNLLLNIFFFKKKYIAIESDSQLNFPKNYFKKIVKYIYLNFVFRNNHILGFAGGSVTHISLFKHYGMDESRIFLIPMMINNSKFYVKEKKHPDIFTFLYVGRLIDTKNVDKLCECFLKYFGDKEARLFIVGDGDNLIMYKQKYMSNKIKFFANKYGCELIEIYHSSSAFVFPSTVEAWGLVVNEAMSSSLPVISHANVGAIHDLIINRKTGFVFDNFDQLGNLMISLYENPDLVNEYSLNSESIMKNYWNYSLYKQNF